MNFDKLDPLPLIVNKINAIAMEFTYVRLGSRAFIYPKHHSKIALRL